MNQTEHNNGVLHPCSSVKLMIHILPQALAKSLDFIINTASGDIPFDPYLSLLKTAGVLVVVGSSEIKLSPASLVMGMVLTFYIYILRRFQCNL